MPKEQEPTFAELLATTGTSAVHLEMHDQHMTSDPAYQAWLVGQPPRQAPQEQYQSYTRLVSDAVARGVVIRRARIVSEPVSDYVRWEHSLTEPVNIAAGEKVRWLPRSLASTLALPGNPYWVFDERLVRFSLFGGDGEVHGHQYSEDPEVIKLCMSAFEAVWENATPHGEYNV
ncbi:hypothetical protein GCM10010191_68610 [Actinomadura vinacea]|uniref:DUF6879 domain-containing protein n=1 Tax=Actinomadura vinacea TaxID=115336 RepID=A0ABN3K0D2_9ACTN